MKEKQKIEIIKLDSPEHCGDWHDKPIRWSVNGPGSECQKFSTKCDAQRYASVRRKLDNQLAAINSHIRNYVAV